MSCLCILEISPLSSVGLVKIIFRNIHQGNISSEQNQNLEEHQTLQFYVISSMFYTLDRILSNLKHLCSSSSLVPLPAAHTAFLFSQLHFVNSALLSRHHMVFKSPLSVNALIFLLSPITYAMAPPVGSLVLLNIVCSQWFSETVVQTLLTLKSSMPSECMPAEGYCQVLQHGSSGEHSLHLDKLTHHLCSRTFKKGKLRVAITIQARYFHYLVFS